MALNHALRELFRIAFLHAPLRVPNGTAADRAQRVVDAHEQEKQGALVDNVPYFAQGH